MNLLWYTLNYIEIEYIENRIYVKRIKNTSLNCVLEFE